MANEFKVKNGLIVNGNATLKNGLYDGSSSLGTSGYVLKSTGTATQWSQAQSITISSTAPASPLQGDLWWDSDIGSLFIYYNDGTSSQWVEAVAVPQVFTENPAGTFTLTGNLITTGDLTVQGTLYETSDEKLKKNIKTINEPLNTVSSLRGVQFDWVKTDKPSIGLIAQEVEKVLPFLVSEDPTGTKAVNYSAVIGLLIESVKELNLKVEELQQKREEPRKSTWSSMKRKLGDYLQWR